VSDPSFEQDIRPLFRDSDIAAMSSMIDLSSYDDVRSNANEIYERVSEGSMPCDGPWPENKVELFRSWMDAGMAA
jgi:hypothetical protein